MAVYGYDIDRLLSVGWYHQIIEYILTEKGLFYENSPKGLIPFHKYRNEKRTAFEEQLVEAIPYIKNDCDTVHLHFTVPQDHLSEFYLSSQCIRKAYEKRYKIHFQIDFSVQSPSTHTIVVDPCDRPLRSADGCLIFSPSGHGALIENLNNTKNDIVFIKNIDNIAPDILKPITYQWKRALGGYLIKVQKTLFSYLEQLTKSYVSEKVIENAMRFAEIEFSFLPPDTQMVSLAQKRAFLVELFNRPIRVCGMVKNRGHAGGGPFWVKRRDGSMSLQIVEKAQINTQDKEQLSILQSSTHFNPVDIVCGLRNWQGISFDLRQYVNPDTGFISIKTRDGMKMKILERPGLWNGSMDNWNTIFIEVPEITFCPVKSINDLLTDRHQMV